MDYPESFSDLPKRERKKQIKAWKKSQQKRARVVIKIRNWSIIVIIIVVFGELIYINLPGEPIGDHHDIEGSSHTTSDVEYQTNPPTSGDHHGEPMQWGVYQEEVSDERAVHNLEHGGIWISYKNISDEDRLILEDIAKSNKGSVLVSPRLSNDNPIALTSWGQLLTLDNPDEEVIKEFIKNNKNRSPEPLAR